MSDPNRDPRFRCFCGICHVVTGTQFSLLIYVLLSGFSLFFGMKSTLTWLIVPLCVVCLAMYALISRRHKYLYPFLIITVVQQLVCVLMALIVASFSAVSFDTMRQIIGHSLSMSDTPSAALSMLVICGTVGGCIILAFVHIWQAVIIYRCLEYYEDCYNKLDSSISRFDTCGESRWENLHTENLSTADPPFPKDYSHLEP